MKTHKNLLIETTLASLACATFNSGVWYLMLARTGTYAGIQLLLINLSATFLVTFIPLLIFNFFRYKKL
ncbi:MAG TPA: hypothetical protein PJ984_04535 [Candidatus Saccharibacteria bacterium]|nr:hypothetical protein [Candidatus Saccharibacteria bacterium]